MRIETRFGNWNAADVWDARFRWREGGRLRDVTVDDTWRRVARAIAEAGGGPDIDTRARTYAQGFARWRLLPAATLLASAGVQPALPRMEAPHVLLNAAAFVAEGTSEPRVDWSGFAESARLAPWILDDVAAAAAESPPLAWAGLIGVGAALARLRIAYDSAEARSLATRFAVGLSVATVEASIDIANERGARFPVAGATLERWRSIGVAEGVLSSAERLGMRLHLSTRVARAPILASLAATTDALDPAPGWRAKEPAGAEAAELAQAAMRRAVQPWLDEPMEVAAT